MAAKKETKRRTDLTGRHDVTTEEILKGLLPDDARKSIVRDIPPPKQKKSKWDKIEEGHK